MLKSTWLIDEFEQSLKSVQHYRTALEHILRVAPDLVEYLYHYAVVVTGDHPTWKYNKNIVAEVVDLIHLHVINPLYLWLTQNRICLVGLLYEHVWSSFQTSGGSGSESGDKD